MRKCLTAGNDLRKSPSEKRFARNSAFQDGLFSVPASLGDRMVVQRGFSCALALGFMSRFDLQGHRGARGLKPENTLPGFEIAFDVGVTTVETDIHLTSDGVPVPYH